MEGMLQYQNKRNRITPWLNQYYATSGNVPSENVLNEIIQSELAQAYRDRARQQSLALAREQFEAQKKEWHDARKEREEQMLWGGLGKLGTTAIGLLGKEGLGDIFKWGKENIYDPTIGRGVEYAKSALGFGEAPTQNNNNFSMVPEADIYPKNFSEVPDSSMFQNNFTEVPKAYQDPNSYISAPGYSAINLRRTVPDALVSRPSAINLPKQQQLAIASQDDITSSKDYKELYKYNTDRGIPDNTARKLALDWAKRRALHKGWIF